MSKNKRIELYMDRQEYSYLMEGLEQVEKAIRRRVKQFKRLSLDAEAILGKESENSMTLYHVELAVVKTNAELLDNIVGSMKYRRREEELRMDASAHRVLIDLVQRYQPNAPEIEEDTENALLDAILGQEESFDLISLLTRDL